MDRATESSPGKGGNLNVTIQVAASTRSIDFSLFIPERHFLHRAVGLEISGGEGDKYTVVFERDGMKECKGVLKVSIVFDGSYCVEDEEEEGDEDENEMGVAVLLGEQKPTVKQAMRRVTCVLSGSDQFTLNGKVIA
jgi:hypothetical protein